MLWETRDQELVHLVLLKASEVQFKPSILFQWLYKTWPLKILMKLFRETLKTALDRKLGTTVGMSLSILRGKQWKWAQNTTSCFAARLTTTSRCLLKAWEKPFLNWLRPKSFIIFQNASVMSGTPRRRKSRTTKKFGSKTLNWLRDALYWKKIKLYFRRLLKWWPVWEKWSRKKSVQLQINDQL